MALISVWCQTVANGYLGLFCELRLFVLLTEHSMAVSILMEALTRLRLPKPYNCH